MSERTGARASGLLGTDELLALVPLIVALWEDGSLSRTEVEGVHGAASSGGLLAAGDVLSDEARSTLAELTDPAKPPSPTELASWRRWIRTEGSLLDEDALIEATASLADLGLSLWSRSERPGPWSEPDAARRLHDLERDVGLLGGEAARRMLDLPATDVGPEAPKLAAEPRELHAILEADRRELRERVLALLERPELAIPLGLPHQEYRERVLTAVRLLADEGLGRLGYPPEHGGAGEPGAAIASFETLAFGDLSVLVKYGVQFGLFGGSILQLGTERHHETYLPKVGTLELPGCYAMTETGHGSNVRDLATTATYDPEREELVVHSPSPAAGKDWIGNAALHGRLATVFARLVVGDDDHGVHALLVPIRDQDGATLPGIRIEDRGLKLGLNGVDNGRIWFDQVRVPVDNLLDRFATIDRAGRYHSSIPSAGRRFFTMLGTLVAGRVSIASASVSAAKRGLTVAVRYTAGRRQFGPSGGPEIPLLGYRAMQRTLMPRVATTYALHFAVRDLQRRYETSSVAAAGSAGDTPLEESDTELEVMAAGLKAWASEQCVDTLQAGREACGGQGYLAENLFAALKADTDVFTTFEGANLVLYQLVARGLLSRYRTEMGSLDLRGAIRYLGERAETSLTELNPLVTRRTEESHLMDPAFHRAALSYREDRLLRSVAVRMRARLSDGMDSFDAVNEVQDHLVSLARAHVEHIVLDAFRTGVDASGREGGTEALGRLAALFALSRIDEDRGWYLEAGYLEPGKSRAIRTRVSELCTELAGCAVGLVDAFGIPEPLLPELVRQ